MAIASFEEEGKLIQETSVPESSHLFGLSGFLVRKGLAANQTSADLTLLVLAGLIVVLSFFAYRVFGGSHGIPAPDEKVIRDALVIPATR